MRGANGFGGTRGREGASVVPAPRKVVVHTDILIDYLTHRTAGTPALREIMSRCFCYTTVFNAIELFARARSERESRAIAEALSSMKILGLNAKNAPAYGRLFAKAAPARTMDLLVAGLCIESRLPLVTGKASEFRGIRGLKVVTPARLAREHRTATAVR